MLEKKKMVGTGRFELPMARLCLAPLAGLTSVPPLTLRHRLGRFVAGSLRATLAGRQYCGK